MPMTGHTPRKRFGQHFLHDRHVVQRILDAFAPQPGDTVVEIGPGLGALTLPLLERLPHLHVVELDRDLVAHWRAAQPATRLTVHAADALRFDFRALMPNGGKLRLIGNLPYNISTPILFHLFDQADVIHDMVFMLQKEVVDRLRATPGGGDYGRLSVMAQLHVRAEKLFDVGPGAFNPPPKVDSSIVRLMPHAQPPVAIHDRARFAQIVLNAFNHRRKMLRKSLAGLVTPEAMLAAGIDPMRRPETLSLAEFAALANSSA
jgi:16S rRNA (adenine1518-N6/adenine1519-N6)-dimethyltransferase